MRKMLCVLCAVLLLSACGASESEGPATLDLDDVSRTLNVTLHAGTTVENWDTHGGFHGDGRAYAEVTFESEPILPGGWNELPMPDDLSVLVYGSQFIGAYVTDEEGTALFPRAEKGRCFFLDRQKDAKDHSPSAVLERPSMNFTVALYDGDTMTLYYYELDT